jgi:hypothetical protein
MYDKQCSQDAPTHAPIQLKSIHNAMDRLDTANSRLAEVVSLLDESAMAIRSDLSDGKGLCTEKKSPVCKLESLISDQIDRIYYSIDKIENFIHSLQVE